MPSIELVCIGPREPLAFPDMPFTESEFWRRHDGRRLSLNACYTIHPDSWHHASTGQPAGISTAQEVEG